MMEPREEAAPEILDVATKHARHTVDLVLEGVCHHLRQQTDTITGWITNKPGA